MSTNNKRKQDTQPIPSQTDAKKPRNNVHLTSSNMLQLSSLPTEILLRIISCFRLDELKSLMSLVSTSSLFLNIYSENKEKILVTMFYDKYPYINLTERLDPVDHTKLVFYGKPPKWYGNPNSRPPIKQPRPTINLLDIHTKFLRDDSSYCQLNQMLSNDVFSSIKNKYGFIEQICEDGAGAYEAYEEERFSMTEVYSLFIQHSGKNQDYKISDQDTEQIDQLCSFLDYSMQSAKRNLPGSCFPCLDSMLLSCVIDEGLNKFYDPGINKKTKGRQLRDLRSFINPVFVDVVGQTGIFDTASNDSWHDCHDCHDDDGDDEEDE
eukprot:TRINITY_DN294_c0_g1_i3.p1 TRINITY_DN294_c0_g1~~TRINITY_DN294_c0_g1_i3.p1  ORF type:complete len:333 (+),score=32.43 TRINITY_DN294_c0_g1_i3:35-1000(+)